MTRRAILLLIIVCVASDSFADTSIVQIGGGNKIENSQGQIEDNVIWLSQILKKSSNDITTFYASGAGDEVDVAFYGEPHVNDLTEPLSRVFDYGDAHLLKYAPNSVPDLSGSTRKDELTESITNILSGFDPDDNLLLIFNGHGDINEEDVRLNTIKLWGDEKLNVEELDSILDKAPNTSNVRYVFPQCFSGGFYSLIFETPVSMELAKQNRCGFFAESPYDESEGCSLSTNKEEYRDYSTYFFAPLNGSTRSGQELPIEVDLNKDGKISYRESHIYALKVGESKDLSRSTSEIYLEQWVPWYLRWAFGEEDKNSLYWQVAVFLADKHGLDMDGRVLSKKKNIIRSEMDENKRIQDEYEDTISELSVRIKKSLKMYWPELFHPYTLTYLATINNKASVISDFIRQHESYMELVKKQSDLNRLHRQELDLERKIAQMDKILRMKKLARLSNYFAKYATEQSKREYTRILACEEGEFFRLK